MTDHDGEVRSRQMRTVGEVLDGVLAKVGVGGGPSILSVFEVWPRVAGEVWIEQAKPARLEQGVLVVEVADGLTASRLRFDIPGLQLRLNEALGGGVIDSVRLKTGARGARPDEAS